MTKKSHNKQPSPPGTVDYGGFAWPDLTGDPVPRAAQFIFAEAKYIGQVLQNVEKRDVCLQAGGNVGVFPAFLSIGFDSVYTFEPEPRNYECLVHNTAHLINISPRRVALGDKPDHVHFAIHDSNCGAHRVDPAGKIRVEQVTIDSVLNVCNLIWLDVEGRELAVLRGAERLLQSEKPVIVTEEMGLGPSPAEYLASLGYKPGPEIRFAKLYLP